jgi:thiol-disulfide isomerase/thioredoxin
MDQKPPSRARKLLDHGLTAALVVVIVLNIWWFFLREAPEQGLNGQPAPTFTLPTAQANGRQGPDLALEDLRGKVVLLDFWATWCGPCKKQMPILQRIHADLPPDKFALVSINIDKQPVGRRLLAIQAQLKKGGYTFPVVMDNGATQAAYGVTNIPTFFLIDAQGQIIQGHRGLIGEDELRRTLQPLLDTGSS